MHTNVISNTNHTFTYTDFEIAMLIVILTLSFVVVSL